MGRSGSGEKKKKSRGKKGYKSPKLTRHGRLEPVRAIPA